MLLEKHTEWELLYFIYDLVDELLKQIDPLIQKRLLGNAKSHSGRPSKLSLSAIISLGVFRYVLANKNVKAYHRHLRCYYFGQLGEIPNYQNFNRLLNQSLPWIIFILQYLMLFQKQKTQGPQFIDSTALKVCANRRIFDHKVCKGLAQRGKTSMGWFFGFKLHWVVNSMGDLLSMLITPGNTDDRIPVLKLLKELKGLVVADAGYLSKKLMEKLFKKGILFITDVKKNMKRLMSQFDHQLLKQRQRVEVSFSVLKYRLNAEATVSRSPVGFFSRTLYACLTYMIQRILQNSQTPKIA